MFPNFLFLESGKENQTNSADFWSKNDFKTKLWPNFGLLGLKLHNCNLANNYKWKAIIWIWCICILAGPNVPNVYLNYKVIAYRTPIEVPIIINSVDNVATLARSSLLIRQKNQKRKSESAIFLWFLVTSVKGTECSFFCNTYFQMTWSLISSKFHTNFCLKTTVLCKKE